MENSNNLGDKNSELISDIIREVMEIERDFANKPESQTTERRRKVKNAFDKIYSQNKEK